ncbi:g390 [Coccomyxa viridis]|uniref:G390 protein n=1 Tax=Coccomyxa viridis TaxID=1274662 RepID=A0ABP1FM82_9CHLO
MPRPVRPAARQAITCRAVSRRAVLGTVCGCGLCQGRLQWYDRYMSWNMANFEEEYSKLVGPRKAELFSDFMQSPGQQPLQLVDIGAGTLPNSRYYKGCKVTAVDPNRTMQPYAEKNAATHELEGFEAVVGMAEQLPFQDSSFDRAVCTLVFCSVPDLKTSLQEIKRVLKPGGKLLFWDHVLADDSKPLLRLGQNVLTPLQQALADGCHLNRDPLPAIQQAGFAIEQQHRFTVEGLGVIGPHQCGIAVA